MKKVVIVNNNMHIGGVQKALVNLLNEIHKDYDVTLLLFDKSGDYLTEIPNDVKITTCNGAYQYFGISQTEAKQKSMLSFLIRGLLVLITKIFGRKTAVRLMNLTQPCIPNRYDVAISFLHEGSQKTFYGGCNDFVLKKVISDKKIAWLHCDFEQCGANNEHSRNIYPKFDKIVACSDGCGQSFLRCLPDLTDKVVVIRNCNDYNAIKNAASNGINYDDSFFNVVTVARLSGEKGIERGIVAVESCIKAGLQVHYHIVGSGVQENKLKQMVVEHRLENAVFFYGNQKNPYPYIINADLFLLPSYHEAAPMVFDEAACLGVPILATKTTSTDEMVLASGNGYVCDNNTVSICENLIWILQHRNDLKIIKHNMLSKCYSNQDSIVEFAKLVE